MVFCCLLTADCRTQQPYHYNINATHGLACNEVYQIHQDRQGFLWLGTDKGLYKYDGVKFKKFINENQNGIGVTYLHEDSRGRIWCSNFTGQIFYTKQDSLELFANWYDNALDFARMVLDTTRDVLWCNGSSELYGFDVSVDTIPKDIEKIQIDVECHLACPHRAYFADSQGDVWFKSCYVNRGKIVGNQMEIFDHISPEAQNGPSNIYMFENKRGVHMIFQGRDSEYNQLVYYEGDELEQVPLPEELLTTRIYKTETLRDGRIAVCTHSGLVILDENLELQTPILLPDQHVSDVLLDKESTLWITTLQNGVFAIPSENVLLYNTDNSQIPFEEIVCIASDNDERVYMGSYSGDLARMDQDHQFELFHEIEGTFAVEALRFDKHRNKIVASNLGLLEFSPDKIHEDPLKYGKWNSGNIKDYASLGKSFFTVGSGLEYHISAVGDLARSPNVDFPYSPADSVVTDYFFESDPNESTFLVGFLGFSRINSLCYSDKSGELWASTRNGVFMHDSEGRHEIALRGEAFHCVDIESNSSGEVYLSGVMGQIYQAHGPDLQLLYDLSAENPVVAPSICCNDTLLVAAADNSLVFIDLRTKEASSFDHIDGLPPSEITEVDIVGDKVFAATSKGLVSIPLNVRHSNNIAPSVIIKSVVHAGKPVVTNQELNLSYAQNQLDIALEGASLRSRGKFSFKYRLAGLEEEWNTNPSDQSVVHYPTIPPGDYTFEAMLVNEDGVASDVQKFGLSVSEPYWRQWWFYVLAGILLLTVSAAFFSRILRNQDRKAQLIYKLKGSEITALKAQMNPHFIFNSLNSIQGLVLKRDLRTSNNYLGKFSDLMRSTLNASGKEWISLEEEIHMLKLYLELEKLRFSKDLTVVFDYADIEEEADQLLIPSMIIQPHVENAIKHGLMHKEGEKQLEIHFTKEAGRIRCVIHDNGIGRKEAIKLMAAKKSHNSFSGEANARRISLMNELYGNHIEFSIEDQMENGKPAGTRVIFSYPLKYQFENT